jgi:hypothetical protein
MLKQYKAEKQHKVHKQLFEVQETIWHKLELHAVHR